MVASEARVWKILRLCVYWVLAAVVAVYAAAGISTIQEELTGVSPEELVSETYSWLVYGRSHEASELERALKAMKEPNESPPRPGDVWGKQMPPGNLFDWEELFQELTYIAAADSDFSADVRRSWSTS